MNDTYLRTITIRELQKLLKIYKDNIPIYNQIRAVLEAQTKKDLMR